MRTIIILVCVMLAYGAVPSTAQTATASFDGLRTDAQPGQTVFVTDLAGKTFKGRIVKISPESIELRVHGNPREWRASDVGWISERHRHTWRGTGIGLAIGAVFGSALLMTDCPKGCGTDVETAFLVTGLFGGIGAGAGAAIGAVTRSERVLYVAPTRQTSNGLSPLVVRGGIGVRAQLRF